jgi:hypothetical protein
MDHGENFVDLTGPSESQVPKEEEDDWSFDFSDDDGGDEIISDEEFNAILAESRARAVQKCSEMLARLGLREDAGIRYDDGYTDEEEEEEDGEMDEAAPGSSG